MRNNVVKQMTFSPDAGSLRFNGVRCMIVGHKG